MLDERPFGSTAPPAAVYLYSPDCTAQHAHALLSGCRGHLHADGYTGFGRLYEPDAKTGVPAPLIEVTCWAHARRKLYDIHVATRSPAASHALELIGTLFAIEAGIRGRPSAERRGARVERSALVLAELKAHLNATLARISGKTPFAAAIRYTTPRWTALTRFVEDRRLELSNNAAEQAIRPLTLGRKTIFSPAPTRAADAPRSFTS